MHTPMNISIIDDANISMSSIRMSMQDAFHEANVDKLSLRRDRNLVLKDLENTDILVLPGVSNETCSYYAPMMEFKNDIYQAVHDRGLAILAICAGGYILREHIIYRGSDGKLVEQRGLGFKKGTSIGPVDRNYAPEQPTQSRFDGTRTIRVLYNTLAGDKIDARVCYGDGPGVADTDPESTIIATYPDHGESLTAISEKYIGKGYILSTGVLPEIALNHMIIHKDQAHLFPQINALRMEMEPHENARALIMNDIVERFSRHRQKLATTPRLVVANAS